MKAKKEKSVFADALTRLLDETELFERADWADVLGVTESAISQWLSDKTIPHADHLYVIFETLKGSDLPSEEPLDHFREIAKMQATEVSPNGRRMLPNIWTYMTRAAFDDLSRKLARFSVPEQEALLESLFSKAPEQESGVLRIQKDLPQKMAALKSDVTFDTVALPKTAPQFSQLLHGRGIRCLHSNADIGCVEEVLTSFDDQHFLPPTLQRVVDPEGDDAEAESEEISVKDLLELGQVVIIGQPGTGKSIFLQNITHQLVQAHAREQKTHFPIYVHFSCLSASWPGRSVEELVRSSIPINNESLRPVLIVDGLDEAPQRERGNLIRELSRFVDLNRQVGFVGGSRPMTDLRIFAGITYFRMQPLSDFALNRWIFGRLSDSSLTVSEPRRSDIHTFIAHLSERPAVLNAVRNPLFLSACGSLFRRNAITAFYETDILNECLWLLLDEWERRKKVVRLNDAWARPQRLYSFLGDLSYHCMRTRSFRFTTAQVASWTKNLSYEAPVESMLTLLSEMTGLVRKSSEEHWRFTHTLFQEYLAARYAVESSRNTVEVLGEKLAGEGWDNAFRLACSITNDASPMIRYVLRDAKLSEADQSVLLADIIAQDITAERDLIETSCDTVINWLGKSFSTYAIEPEREKRSEDGSKTLWQLSARSTKLSATLETANGRRVRRVLNSLHRARSSPMRGTLIKKLANSSNGVVREFSNCVKVEGKYEDWVKPSTQGEYFSAQVQEVSAVM